MDIKLTVRCELEGAKRSYDLEFQQNVITIGSESHNDVHIPDRQVDPDHARIEVDGVHLFLVDHGTEHGTVLDGKRIEPSRRVPLRIGGEISIASYRITPGLPDHQLDETTSERTAKVAMNLVREVLGSLSESKEPPSLKVLNDLEAGALLELTEDREYVIGRTSECDLMLKHWSISRRHAGLRRNGDEVLVTDLGSKNGVTVNGRRISSPQTLRDGDVVAVGHTELRLKHPARSKLDSLGGLNSPSTSLRDLEDLLGEGGPDSGKDLDSREMPTRPAAESGDDRRDGGRSLADRLPLVLGVLLLLAAAAAAVYLFVLRK